MRERLIDYVHSLFRYAPEDPRNRELEEEILQNSLDRFDDLVSRGITQEQAYQQAVENIGDVRHLWVQGGAAPVKRRRKTGWILAGCCVALLAVVAAVGLLMLRLDFGSWDWEDRLETKAERLEDMADGVEEKVEARVESWFVDVPIGGSTVRYPDAAGYTAGAAAIAAENIRELKLHWMIGRVEVALYDGAEIVLSEGDVKNTDEQLHWRLKDGVLEVQYCAEGTYTKLPEKILKVQLPATMADALTLLYLDTVSADCTVSGLMVEQMGFDSTSGNLRMEGSCRTLSADTTSGGVICSGTVTDAELDTVSGQFELTLAETPGELSFDSTSGDLILAIPGERSFEVELDSVSGNLNCDFETTKIDEDTWYYEADGARAEFELDTVSGDVNIRKASF